MVLPKDEAGVEDVFIYVLYFFQLSAPVFGLRVVTEGHEAILFKIKFVVGDIRGGQTE